MTERKDVSGTAPRITEEAARAAKGTDAYSPFFEVTPETGNALQDPATVKQLAQLKHADPPRFFDLIDVLTDRGVRLLPELSRKVDRYLKRQADATKRKSAVALPRLHEIEQDTENYFGEITNIKGGDVANGKAFAERYRGHLLYVDAAPEWRRFNGNHWEKCSQSNIDSAAKSVLRIIINQCADGMSYDQGERTGWELKKALSAYDRLPKVRAVAEAGRSEHGMFVNDPARFDKDLWLLGVQNGVIDLRTGSLLPPDPGLLISKIAGTEYYEDAACPLWLETLDAIFQGDAELIDFVQRGAGYTLCGDVSEEVCFFLYGAGANGKSTVMMVLHGVLGEYVGTLSSRVIARSHGNETEVRLAKAGAVGKRMIWSNETKEGDVFDDDVLKVFSSRDPIPDARWHHQRPFVFTPTHTLWMRGNHKPGVRDTSYSFWRRIIPITFRAKFEGAAIKHNLDKRILAAEAPGVLRWMVEGCLKWQRDGRLIIPDSVEAERASYRDETDILGQWIAQCCELDRTAVAQQSALFNQYQFWMQEENFRGIGSRTAFGRRLEGRGFPRGENGKGRTVQGLRLKSVSGCG